MNTFCINRIKSLRFPVKGVGGLSLIFSEAFGVVVVAMVLAMVFSCCWCRYRFQYQGVKYRRVKVSWYQGVGVRCKDTGTFIGEFTLLLDFKRLTKNVNSLL
jgi:hypothetical protein